MQELPPEQEGDRAAELEDRADTAAEAERPVEAAPLSARYHSEEEREELYARWTSNGLAERIRLGQSAGGRAIGGVVVGAPGPVPLAERLTIVVVGGLDGSALVGAEAAARCVDELLGSIDRLAEDVAVVVVPWANPDGLARSLRGLAGGRNDAARDDDQDGLSDEDPPDDLDGDGVILSMLVEDVEGPYARAQDQRFLRPALPTDGERWRLVPEGADDDGDGRFNEDGPGGIRLEADFPFGWWPGEDTGRTPLSQPETRALAGLLRARRVAVALFLQGDHGRVAVPGGTDTTRAWLGDALEADAAAWRTLHALLGGELADGPRDLQAVRDRAQPGHPVDWLYAARGVLALEWSPWGPSVERAPGAAAVPREGSFSELASRPLAAPDEPALAGVDPFERRWARWLDDTRGGLGFVDWMPLELPGTRALVGGWEPRTRKNPPEELLGEAVAGTGQRVLAIAEGLPRLRVETVARERDGGVVRLTLRVHNDGRLPTGAGPLGEDGGLRLALRLPEGAALLAGEEKRSLGHLGAGAAAPPSKWLVRAKEHALVQVVLDSPWRGREVVEVRL